MHKVEIDDDTADRIVVCSLKQSILYLREDVKKIKKKKYPSNWDKMTVAENILALDYLEKTLNYYGGNIK